MNYTQKQQELNPIIQPLWDLLQEMKQEIKELKEQRKPSLSRRGGIELAVEVTGYSKKTIERMAATGEIPKLSGYREKLQFDEVELREWQDSRKSKSTLQLQAEALEEYKTLKRATR